MTRLLAFVTAAMVTTQAFAHDAPTGWSYSAACCSGIDCGQLHTEVRATDQGYFITETGELIGYSDRRIKNSQDEFYHRCENRSVAKLPNGMYETRCLYKPAQSY